MHRLVRLGVLGLASAFLVALFSFYSVWDACVEATSTATKSSLPSPGTRLSVERPIWVAVDETEVELTYFPETLAPGTMERLASQKRLLHLMPGTEVEVVEIWAPEDGGASLVDLRIEGSGIWTCSGAYLSGLHVSEVPVNGRSTGSRGESQARRPQPVEQTSVATY